MFRVGQKVVCIDDSATDREGGKVLIFNRIYTIRWIGSWAWYNPKWDSVVKLTEIIRGPDKWNPKTTDMPFYSSRFRPIVERKTDVSIFTEMLKTKELYYGE